MVKKTKEEKAKWSEKYVKTPKSKFVKLKCAKCKNEQIVFGKATTSVECLVCGEELATPSGGKSKTKAEVLETV